jgi:hypothetical protein
MLGPECLQTARRSEHLDDQTDENGGSEAFLWKLVRLGSDEPDAQSTDSHTAQTFCRECDADLFYALHPLDSHVYVFTECIQTVERHQPVSNDHELVGWRRYIGRTNSTGDPQEGRVEPFVLVDSQERGHPSIVPQYLRQQSIETGGSSGEENEPSGSASSLHEAEQCPTAASQLLASVFTTRATSSSSHSRPPNPLLLHRKQQQGLSYPLHSNNPRSAPCDPRALAALASYPPVSSSSSIISRASSASSWSVPEDTASFVAGPGGDLGLSAPHNAVHELNPLCTEILSASAQQSCTETAVPQGTNKTEPLEPCHNLDQARRHSDENKIRTRSQSRQVA